MVVGGRLLCLNQKCPRQAGLQIWPTIIIENQRADDPPLHSSPRFVNRFLTLQPRCSAIIHIPISMPLIIQLRAECGHYICIGNIIRNYRTRNHSVRGERWEDLQDAGEEGGHERKRLWAEHWLSIV